MVQDSQLEVLVPCDGGRPEKRGRVETLGGGFLKGGGVPVHTTHALVSFSFFSSQFIFPPFRERFSLVVGITWVWRRGRYHLVFAKVMERFSGREGVLL